ncbi:hypothetical protein Cni_G26092 [Canna indica]|uniref:Reverse transcriptase domain-containing protein n=1 Tax=Canna indica TaxID=4628 RepID=A0AAQ3QLN4_9LILI|nr:hypothetical protein Cni_G26092 [Canna indica]
MTAHASVPSDRGRPSSSAIPSPPLPPQEREASRSEDRSSARPNPKAPPMSWAHILRENQAPIPKGLWVHESGKEFFQPLAYENLPSICFTCGLISHREVDCPSKSIAPPVSSASQPGTHPSVVPSGSNVSLASSMEVNSDALPNLNAVVASPTTPAAKNLTSAGLWILVSHRNSHHRFQKVPRSPSRGRPSSLSRHMGGSEFDQTRFASRDKSGDPDWYAAFDEDLGESTGIEGESERILKSVGGSDVSTATRTAGRALARQLAGEGVSLSHRDVRGRNPPLRVVETSPSQARADPSTMSTSSSKEAMGRVASIEKPKKLSVTHFSTRPTDQLMGDPPDLASNPFAKTSPDPAAPSRSFEQLTQDLPFAFSSPPHWPSLLLNCMLNLPVAPLNHPTSPLRPPLFKFQNFWIDYPESTDVVRNAWGETPIDLLPYPKFSIALSFTRKALSVWNKHSLGVLKNTLYDTIVVISTLERLDAISGLNFDDENKLRTLNNKAIALRRQISLKCWWPKNKSAFIKGRFIQDNILIIQEISHSMYGSKSKNALVMVKIDLEKAYDKVSWAAIIVMLKVYKFPDKFVDWIKIYLSSVSFACLVNGRLSSFFHSNRGIRQGDPLSPYLFVLTAHVLTCLIDKAVQSGKLTPFKIRNAAPVSHLLFADDILLTFRANPNSLDSVKKIFKDFEKFTGLSVNFEKSSIFYPKSTSRECIAHISSIMNIRAGSFPFKYLGTQIFPRRPPNQIQKQLVDSINAKLSTWQAKFLSQAGRLVLIKSVLSSMPLHSLAVTWASSSTIDKIEICMRKFLWSGKGVKKGLHLVKWDVVTLPKELKYKDLRLFNCFDAKCSWSWKLFRNAFNEFRPIFFKIINSGVNTSIMLDYWLGDLPLILKPSFVAP